MTYEAGFCVFAFVAFCAVMVYALYRRALNVDESVYDDWASAVNETCENINELLSRDDVLELAESVRRDELDAISEAPIYAKARPMKICDHPKGWQPWEGGDCPVSWAQDVVIMRRNGSIESTYGGGETWWHAEIFSGQYDILAYRIAD